MNDTTLDLLQEGTHAKGDDMPFAPALVGGPAPFLSAPPSMARLRQVKFAYTTRRIFDRPIGGLLVGDLRPRPGDAVLARVDQLGQHKRLEMRTGRRAMLFPGDEIAVCYGNRYAPDQFEAEMPEDLSPCHLVAAGGVASRAVSSHVDMGAPTAITPIGLLADPGGERLSLASCALEPPPMTGSRPLTIAVVGSTMNAGKTTTAANLVRGVVTSGRRVGAAKVTGTGAGGDVWFLSDSGANPALDFTAVGLPSTYLAGYQEVERAFCELTAHLASSGVDVAVIEVADGVYQEETADLLGSECFRERIDGVIFAAGDALGAVGAVEHVAGLDVELLAISGKLSASPLAAREAQRAIGVPVVDIEALRDRGFVEDLLGSLRIAVAA